MESQKLYFRQNGFYIEFTKFNWEFVGYTIKRGLQFLFDMGLFIGLMYILWLVFEVDLVVSTVAIIGLNWLYTWFVFYVFKNRTIGMLLVQLIVTNFDGDYMITSGKRTWRVFMSSVYLIPFAGIVIAIVSFFSVILTKGISVVDLATKSQVLTKYTALRVNQLYTDINAEA